MPIVLLSGASGVGKSAFNSVLLQPLGFTYSVSATTRDPRPGEIDGQQYRFMCQNEFIRHIINRRFIEWAGVHHGDLYGTFREPLEWAFHEGGRILAEIDVDGHNRLIRNATPQMREDIFSVFIKAPSREELEKRLRKRNDIPNEAKLQQRLARADYEESHSSTYDLVITNGSLEELPKKQRLLMNTIDDRFGCWQVAA